jgi:phosphate transport system permease protein
MPRRLTLPWLSDKRALVSDRLLYAVTFGGGTLLVVLLVGMLLGLVYLSRESLSLFGPSFLGVSSWDPLRNRFGALSFVWGTLVSSLLALLLAVPIGFGSAICLAELAPRPLRGPLGFLVDLLAAVPSVVYGLWGIFTLVPLLRDSVGPLLSRELGFLPLFEGSPSGFGMLAGGVVLAIMIVPTVASVSRDVLLSVPAGQREAALSLGATRAETVRWALVPAARAGLVGAVILGFGRALGETIAVSMLIGNRAGISWSLFAPGHSMASIIAAEFRQAASDLHLAALAEIALLLFVVSLLLNVFARWLVQKVSHRPGVAT